MTLRRMLVPLGALALAVGLAGCQEEGTAIPVVCPQGGQPFRAVSAVFEKTCGTLDCHGDIGRPMKIYGQNGLRSFTAEDLLNPGPAVDAGRSPGGELQTTDEELDFNRRSICGLEPEKMARVYNLEIPATELMLLRKALEVERHKGGKLFIETSPGKVCIETWLTGDVNIQECDTAALSP
jgi:hypothetical protein